MTAIAVLGNGAREVEVIHVGRLPVRPQRRHPRVAGHLRMACLAEDRGVHPEAGAPDHRLVFKNRLLPFGVRVGDLRLEASPTGRISSIVQSSTECSVLNW